MAIDWPNLVAGFILGAAVTAFLWVLDRRDARRSLLADWLSAAGSIENNFAGHQRS